MQMADIRKAAPPKAVPRHADAPLGATRTALHCCCTALSLVLQYTAGRKQEIGRTAQLIAWGGANQPNNKQTNKRD
jgi:hypothetical protein